MGAPTKAAPGSPVRARDWNRIIDALPNVATGTAAGVNIGSQVTAPIQNDGPAIDLGQAAKITGLLTPGDAAEPYSILGETIYTTDAPADAEDGPIVIAVEPILTGETGLAILSGHAIVALETAPTAGQTHLTLSATAPTKFEGATSGLAELLHKLAGDGYALCRIGGGGGGGPPLLCQTPAGGIPARAGIAAGKATCDVWTIDNADNLVTTSTTATIYNPFTTAIAGTVFIQALEIDGKYEITAEDCVLSLCDAFAQNCDPFSVADP